MSAHLFFAMKRLLIALLCWGSMGPSLPAATTTPQAALAAAKPGRIIDAALPEFRYFGGSRQWGIAPRSPTVSRVQGQTWDWVGRRAKMIYRVSGPYDAKQATERLRDYIVRAYSLHASVPPNYWGGKSHTMGASYIAAVIKHPPHNASGTCVLLDASITPQGPKQVSITLDYWFGARR